MDRAVMLAAAGRAGLTRYTAIFEFASGWTVFVREGEKVRVMGRGQTEEEALFDALKSIGVIS